MMERLKAVKGTVMKIERALINDRLCVLKVPWKFRIQKILKYSIFLNSTLFLTVSIVFSVYKQNFQDQ